MAPIRRRGGRGSGLQLCDGSGGNSHTEVAFAFGEECPVCDLAERLDDDMLAFIEDSSDLMEDIVANQEYVKTFMRYRSTFEDLDDDALELMAEVVQNLPLYRQVRADEPLHQQVIDRRDDVQGFLYGADVVQTDYKPVLLLLAEQCRVLARAAVDSMRDELLKAADRFDTAAARS